jgi:hypothetical protein
MKTNAQIAADRRNDAMNNARRVRAEFESYLNAGLIVPNLRTPEYYVREARRQNRIAYQEARISRAWRGDRRALDMPRLLYAYT